MRDDLSIWFADPHALEFLASLGYDGGREASRLPRCFETIVQDAVAKWNATDGEDGERVVSPFPNVVMRLSRVFAPEGSLIAVLIGASHLRVAKLRFGFTQREGEVLEFVVHGRSVHEIAIGLGITDYTAADHVKHLLRKTGAKNRADMVGRVLGSTG